MIREIAKLIRVLNSETAPINISLALCFGMVVGFTNMMSVHNLIILFIVLLFRVNLSAFLLGSILFKSFSFLLNSVFHKIGFALLTSKLYWDIGTYLYNITFWKFDRVHNTVIAGGIVVAIVGFVPLLILLTFIIKKYRKHILKYARSTKLAKAIMSSDFYHYYKKISGLRDSL